MTTESLFTFMERYIQEEFEEEAVLKESSRGVIRKVRHKESHRRYVCREFEGSAQIYLALRGKECMYLPRIYEAAQEDVPGELPGESLHRRGIVLEECLVGDTLAMLLQAGPLTKRQVKDISIQICKGLYVLHTMGWVHRDIKPQNVMICGNRAVLIDFDAARYCNLDPEGENDIRLMNVRRKDIVKKQDTRILGTVGYAPPEQYGISETDYRADIYAVGVLINEMLTGLHPSQKLARGHWGRIVSRCTMASPDKRYNSVRELMEVL